MSLLPEGSSELFPVEEPAPQPAYLSNCYLYVKHIFPSLPPTATIKVNLTQEPSDVVHFLYEDGVEHYAVITSVATSSITIRESNWDAGVITERTVQLNDPSLQGFYSI